MILRKLAKYATEEDTLFCKNALGYLAKNNKLRNILRLAMTMPKKCSCFTPFGVLFRIQVYDGFFAFPGKELLSNWLEIKASES